MTKCMYTLDDILDEGLKFQNRMLIRFPQLVYCSRDEAYISLIILPICGRWRYLAWAAYNGRYASHSWRQKATYDVTAAL